MPDGACLSCGSHGLDGVLSLGSVPLANAYPALASTEAEPRFPLDVTFCSRCSLVQLRQVVPPDAMFSEYLYFSSYSESMLQHARRLAGRVIETCNLGSDSLVVEAASNDGYLLQYFREAGIPVLGIEPAANVARVAEEQRQIPTVVDFFGIESARRLRAQGHAADVILGLNVLAHVPDLNGFLAGITTLLKPSGMAVIEVPYLRDMIEKIEFDTIYHEHLFYFSVTALAAAVERHGLVLRDVERVAIHGGSLRLWIGGGSSHGTAATALLRDERALGMHDPGYYAEFRRAVERVRHELVGVVGTLRREGAVIAGYGAAAKASILLNYCGFSTADVAFVIDRSPHKQGRRMPGCGIPIVAPDRIDSHRPDYLVLFVWNLKEEIFRQQAEYRAAGGRFIVPIPRVHVA